MFVLIRWLFKQEFKNHYHSPWYVLSEVASLLIGLFVYKMTSKALAPHLSQDLQWMNLDYFTFVVLGEAFIMLPLQAFSGGGRIVKGLIVDGIIENFICWPGAVKKILNNLLLATLLRDFIYMLLMLLFAKFFFALNISILSLLYGLIVLILFLPGFLGLGYITSAAILYFGRGTGVLNQLAGLITVMSGVYFPVGVFSDWNFDFLIRFQPFASYLKLLRQTLSDNNFEMQNLIFPILFSLISLFFGSLLFSKSIKLLRRKGLHLFAYY